MNQIKWIATWFGVYPSHKVEHNLAVVSTRISQILGFITYMRKIRPQGFRA